MTASTARLSKHHGLGNDFLVWVDGNVERGGSLAQTWCDRRRGIGADGLLIAHTDGPGRWRMVLFNADGSRAEMSGNGIRCLAQAVAAHRGTRHCDLVVATAAGLRPMEVRPDPDDPATVDRKSTRLNSSHT